MKPIVLLPALLALRTSARPLQFEQPFWDPYKAAVPSLEDNPYGLMEVNSYVGNYYHPDGDSIHNEDLWPGLAPPAAVRRTNPAKVIYGPTATPDVLVR